MSIQVEVGMQVVGARCEARTSAMDDEPYSQAGIDVIFLVFTHR